MNSTELVKLTVGLISIVNPIGGVPIFLSLTDGRSAAQRRRIGLTTSLALLVILLVALSGGEAILRFFGIGIPSFRLAGGILILLMALSMLRAESTPMKHTSEEHRESTHKESISVVPLAMPLLAGPGAISTVIVYAHGDAGWGHYAHGILAIFITAAAVLVVLSLASRVEKAMGRTGMNIVTRVMGLIIAAIAVEFMAEGLVELFPVLGGSAPPT